LVKWGNENSKIGEAAVIRVSVKIKVILHGKDKKIHPSIFTGFTAGQIPTP